MLALNTDASVRRLGKGGDRPVNPLENRAAVAAALESVDLVTWFDEDTLTALIEAVKPEVLVKGGDWVVDKIVGAAETLARGGQVFSIPFLHQTSTTKTLAKSVRQRAENDGFEAFALAGVGGACRRFAATRLATGAYGGHEAAAAQRFWQQILSAYTRAVAPTRRLLAAGAPLGGFRCRRFARAGERSGFQTALKHECASSNDEILNWRGLRRTRRTKPYA